MMSRTRETRIGRHAMGPPEIAELDLERLGRGALGGGEGQRDGLAAGAHAAGPPRRRGGVDLLDSQMIGVGERGEEQREVAREADHPVALVEVEGIERQRPGAPRAQAHRVAPQKSSSIHVAGLGAIMSLIVMVKLISETGSASSGVQGILRKVPIPDCAAFVPVL